MSGNDEWIERKDGECITKTKQYFINDGKEREKLGDDPLRACAQVTYSIEGKPIRVILNYNNCAESIEVSHRPLRLLQKLLKMLPETSK